MYNTTFLISQEINIMYADYNVLGLTYVYNIHAIEASIFLKENCQIMSFISKFECKSLPTIAQ